MHKKMHKMDKTAPSEDVWLSFCFTAELSNL